VFLAVKLTGGHNDHKNPRVSTGIPMKHSQLGAWIYKGKGFYF
jgi:hypothetical protein